MISPRRAAPAAILSAVLALALLPASAGAAVTASFLPSTGVLAVLGDSQSNTIVISRDAAGKILVNGGAVAVQSGSPTVANTAIIQVFGLAGDDRLSLNETSGPLGAARLFGGAGHDTLTGGSGVDLLYGQDGDDTVDGQGGADFSSLGAGADTFAWGPGDGSEQAYGGADRDTVRITGSAAGERIDFARNGGRVRASLGNAAVDVDDVEDARVIPGGGPDTIAVPVGGLGGAELRTVGVDLADGRTDSVVVTGGPFVDAVPVAGSATPLAELSGIGISVIRGEPGLDRLSIAAGAGADRVDASRLPAGLIGLQIDGGPDDDLVGGGGGDDVLAGGAGIDQVSGGAGRDTIDGAQGDDSLAGGAGDDTFRWKPGEGADRIEGETGRDLVALTGSGAGEKFGVGSSAGRVRVARDIALVTDFDGVEDLRLSALGGADRIVVGDLTGTGLALAALDLAAVPRGTTPDGAADAVVVTGTAAADAVDILGSATGYAVGGLRTVVSVAASEGAIDGLTVSAFDGDDHVSALGLTTARLVAHGAAGDDTITGGSRDDVLSGGEGDDFLDGGPGFDALDGGPGLDVGVGGESSVAIP